VIRGVLLVIAVLLVGAKVEAASVMYVGQDAVLTADAGGTIGTVTPATKVAVTSTAMGSSSVVIDGWHPKTESTLIYGGLDSRILLVRMSGSAGSSVQTVATKSDAYHDTWVEVRVTGKVPSAALVPNVGVVWTSGESFYGQRCSTCHTLHSPTQYTVNQWPSLVADMAHNAALSTAQEDLIVSYLQAHARKN
jgi:hypothetical protein